ncbi:MAG: hypothetical protein ACHQJ6_02725 [Candidatus Berkiellales bacterium]
MSPITAIITGIELLGIGGFKDQVQQQILFSAYPNSLGGSCYFVL